jgi:hypothetical protein
MRRFVLIIIGTMASMCFVHASDDQGVSYAPLAPLFLFTNGSGGISPLQGGQLLELGQGYKIEGIPDPGFTFSSWQSVNVLTVTEIVNNENGVAVPVVNIITSPTEDYTFQPVLDFTMQPVTVISDTGLITITSTSGWQANFSSVPEPSGRVLMGCGLTAILLHRWRRFRRERH